MGMKQNIVVKSEYTNNARSQSGGGSRGASPGQYVTRYMAREDATDVLTPVHMSGSDAADASYNSKAFTRYMTRSEATEKLKAGRDNFSRKGDDYDSPLTLKHKFKKHEKQSGRAFGSKGVNLSQEELDESSQEIQQAFDDGHSVQKMVISFTEDYLRETGVLDPDFEYKGRGSYKGSVDQLKLRSAITRGVDDMTKTGHFEDPAWVGTIQYDTAHVHAHIALADQAFSPERMHSDGADRGKVYDREKYMLRRGIHHELEDMRDLKAYHKQASLERQNVTAYVKDYAYATLEENTSVQLLIASLPEERSHWRFHTNRESMQHANQLARQVVERTFTDHPEQSGYDRAMARVHDYADEAVRRRDLNDESRQNLIDNGYEQIVERSVNGLYGTIRNMDQERLQTRTAMTDIQSSSDAELARALKPGEDADAFDPAAFTLRVRGYNKRRESHNDNARTFHDLADEFDDARDEGLVDDSAHVMRLYYEEEQRYHMGLTDKYRAFLSFDYDRQRDNAERMRPDYERLVSHYAALQSQEQRTGIVDEHARDDYKRDLKDYTMACFNQGVASLNQWEHIVDFDRDEGTINTRFVLPERPMMNDAHTDKTHFDRVKAWDVHDLGLDYYNKPDASISTNNVQAFAAEHEERRRRSEQARHYVDETNQQLHVLDETESDLNSMSESVQKALNEGLIETVTPEDLQSEDTRQLYTIAPDYSVDVTGHVRDALDDVSGTPSPDEGLE